MNNLKDSLKKPSLLKKKHQPRRPKKMKLRRDMMLLRKKRDLIQG
jgi:hypothetical protein